MEQEDFDQCWETCWNKRRLKSKGIQIWNRMMLTSKGIQGSNRRKLSVPDIGTEQEKADQRGDTRL